MNFKPRMLARVLVYSSLLCTALGAAAQSQQAQTDAKLLRQALGDPQQRAQIRAARIQHARTTRPDLATVLRLEARTARSLCGLHADAHGAYRLQDLNSAMPAQAKLSAAQKEALVAVYREHMQRDEPWHEQYYDPPSRFRKVCSSKQYR
jgi:hypothetical protein